MWSGAKFGDHCSRDIILDGEIIGEIDIDKWLDATIKDSMVGYNNHTLEEEIFKDIIKITARRTERKVLFIDFKRALNTGWLS